MTAPRVSCVLAAVVIGACGGGEPDPAVVTGRIAERLRIGSVDGAGPATFAEVRALEVDSAGRIYVLDGGAREVRVFGPDGRYIRAFGREGSGPGELREPIGLAWGPDGRLWVVDPGNGRYATFDTAGASVGERRRLVAGWVVPWSGGTDRDGRFWDSFNVVRPGEPALLGFVRLDAELRPADTLLAGPIALEFFETRVGGGSEQAHVPFTPWLTARLDPRGGAWIGDGQRYRLHRLSVAGDTLATVAHEYEPVEVTAEEQDSALARLEWFRRMGGRIDPSRIPDTKPAFDALFVGTGGELWVPLRTPGDEVAGETRGRLWDRFDPAGRYAGRLRTDFDVELYVPRPLFAGDALYAVTTDGLGVQYVVVGTIPDLPSVARRPGPG